jgi:hypothetical protein
MCECQRTVHEVKKYLKNLIQNEHCYVVVGKIQNAM